MTEAGATTDPESDRSPTTVAEPLCVVVRGCADAEQAGRIASSVETMVREMSRAFDLSQLDGVTVAYDYDQAVLEIGRDADPQNYFVPAPGCVSVGMAMTIPVLRDDVLKTHILLNGELVAGFDAESDQDVDFWYYMLAHECVRVELTQALEEAFPGFLLRRRHADLREALLWDCILTCWVEYLASSLSAKLGKDPTDRYEETFLEQLARAQAVADESLRSYRPYEESNRDSQDVFFETSQLGTYEDADRVMRVVFNEYILLFSLAARYLGSLDGFNLTFEDRPKAAAALQDHWFVDYLDELHIDCLRISGDYRQWTDAQQFLAIGELLERVAGYRGVELQSGMDGRVWIEVQNFRAFR